ncbi:SDR family NAD(P)-dependent oxidoreductase [Xanthomonas hortorum]|uniref:SDR family NAD(P)-dependent oxidoreductase n=1 Tax=Xanthomonas hortorum pv. hederae TaxID=453603 RepID=A0A9X4BRI3_9XANT|nr:SDR family NAD(P)-dependent oxidoreductase [Xanthomonas hortorum]MDC8638266.1 SDR family NAD(P)-dependent oxidoreductase [Xanthomonas hortorum pv. hederae]
MGSYQMPRWISRYWKDPSARGGREEREVQAAGEPIAIIGVSAALPLAADLDEFWSNLIQGRDCITTVPPGRFEWESVRGDSEELGIEMRKGGFISGIDEFDPLFFNISPREAATMDPHQRLLLMHAWRAIEDAGYAPRSLAGSDTGVFIGLQVHDYVRVIARADRPAEGYTSTGLLSSVTSNRISHHLDFRGPNEAIDTACSSSLVALHRAVRAIQSGECELALAGAAHLMLTPYLYGSYARAGMLSPDARCKTFSSEANGYVRSEGIGLFLLKRLSLAVRDRDHIHGVIRSTVENHGGAARSLTAPNPRAQADLIYRAYSLVDADPHSIGYIECHGTGTPLGDPIEVEALKSAFDRLSDRYGVVPQTGYCALGSVKANIGHLEIAAGIAGLIKVLLQLRHRTLAPTLHSQPRNPYVVTDGSPFYVVEQSQPWQAPQRDGAPAPRRAGVSSFGFGGVNAHALVEEYCAPPRAPTSARCFPVLLSARSAQALQAQIAALLKAVEDKPADANALLDISHTLACGREAMAHRLGFVADSHQALTGCLRALGEDIAPEQVHHGHVDLHRPPAGGDVPAQAVLESALVSAQVAAQLVRRWVQGEAIDWSTVFGAHAPHRCSLPTYAFEMRRFPLPQSTYPAGTAAKSGGLRLSGEQVLLRRLDLALDGDETYLTDHIIDGARLLPAVAYLELVRAALEYAAPERAGADQPSAAPRSIRFDQVRWLAPFAPAGAASLSVWLHGDASAPIRFEVGAHGERQAPDVVYASGTIARDAAVDRPQVDIAAVRARCRHATHASAQCYEAFSHIGFDYGSSHRTIREVQLGDGEAVARLALTGTPSAGLALDPGILDGALQSVIACHLDARTAWRLAPGARPSRCRHVQVLHASTAAAWAVVRWDATAAVSGAHTAFDIDLCDDDGTLCVRFSDFAFHPAAQERLLVHDEIASTVPADAADMASQGLFVAPAWIPVDSGGDRVASDGVMLVIGGTTQARAALADCDAGIRFLSAEVIDDAQRLRRAIAERSDIRRLLWLVDDDALALTDDAMLDAQTRGVFRCLTLAQAFLAAGYGHRCIDWLTLTRSTPAPASAARIDPVHAGLQGMIGSIAREYPNWRARLIDVPADASLPLHALTRADFERGPVLAYRNHGWYERRACVVTDPPQDEYIVAAESVCLIIGGAGGLGQAFSRALLQRTPDLQLVWMGRRPQAAIQAGIDALASLGPRVHYIQGDAADRASLERARDAIQARFGKIDGLIHAAMTLADRSVERLSDYELREVLAPKVAGCVRLAQVLDPDRLRFALFFSSMNAFATLPGQSNYAAASCFEDAFALAWGAAARCRVRVVNWGYWGEVGAVASEYHRTRMAKAGIAAIQAPEAVNAALRMLNAPLMQYGYLRVQDRAGLAAIGVDQDHRLEIQPRSLVADATAPQAETPLAGADALIAEDAALEQAIVAVLWSQLRALCDFAAPRAAETIRCDARILDAYRPWFERSLDELVRHGYLQRSHDGVYAATAVDSAPAQAWARLREARGNIALRAYAQTMLEALAEVLTGRRSAVDVAFSERTSIAAADSYFNDPALRHCSVVIADIVAERVARLRRHQPGARIRILEVGAGRGATTRRVIDALRAQPDAIDEYAFTDLSAAFLASDRKAALSLPGYVDYRTFDVERDPQAQGLEPGRYDVVIAANVLHATQDIERALAHCKVLLKRDGALLVQELTQNPVYTHVTYGLLEGWWRFTDSWLRLPGGPALSPPTWAALLAQAGFRMVCFPAASAHAHSHQVVFAESDGIWLRPVSTPASTATRAVEPSAKREVASADAAHAISAIGDRQSQMEQILARLQATAAEVLEVDEAVFANDSQPFAEVLLTEYGMDSLSSINLRNALRQRFGIDVPTQQLLGEKTSTIADAIYEQLLMQRLVSPGQPQDAAQSETFVF